jgi:hypothetical protein
MPSRQTNAWSLGPDVRDAASTAANSNGCSTVRFCPSHDTFGGVTAAAGFAGITPSITAYL